MKKKKGKLALNFEYGVFRAFCAAVNAMPYGLSISIAKSLANTAFSVFRFKRKRTLDRIFSVFPGISKREAVLIAKESLANVAMSAVEMIRAPRMDRRWMDKYVVDGAHYKDKLQSYVDEGKGVVVMVPHSGNWYMAAWSMAKYGLPLVSIAARQRNPKIDAWMKRQYGDIEILERGNAKVLVEIKKRLNSGRVFAILPDLRVPQKDVEVDFLGGKANVSHAGAMFAVKCGSPVVVAMMRRENGKHVFDHIATLRPDMDANPKEEAIRITREAMRLLDERIRKHPAQWFWYNKRWILQPVFK
jgi:KDO2-lipid IV(A) lauroyltransferase